MYWFPRIMGPNYIILWVNVQNVKWANKTPKRVGALRGIADSSVSSARVQGY